MVEKKKAAYNLIFMVFMGLAILTGIEFYVGTLEPASAVFLLILAFAKTVLVVYYFMHVYKLWREDDH
ncbi:MAG: cytochrome C oxidase subunit IV family protein [Candidatus Promineifilaceae bacterium]